MQLPISIGLRRSFWLDGFVAVLALAASTAILYFPETAKLRWAILVFVWLVAAYAWWCLKPRIIAIRLDKSGGIFVSRGAGADFVEAKPLPGATVHPWLIVLRLRTGDSQTVPLVLTAAGMASDEFRRLRVFLRWRATFSAPVDDV